MLSACNKGEDAVVQGGQFQFISPGGQTDFFYPKPDRKKIGNISGPSLTDPHKTISLNDYANHIVLINFWGPWCSPCRGEIATLEHSFEEFNQLGVNFLGIDFRDELRQGEDEIKNNHITYPSIVDRSGISFLALRGLPSTAIPVTVIIDNSHKVAAIFIRKITATDINSELEKLLKETQ